MDFHVARRHGVLAIAEQLYPPGALCDSILFAGGAAAEDRAFLIPLRHAGGERAAGIFFNEVLDADEPVVIVGVQIDAEKTGQKDAVAQFQTPQFHVADQLIDDDLSANSSLWLLGSALRHMNTPNLRGED